MTSHSNVSCSCGTVSLVLTGPAIMTVECMCDSCRAAGRVLASLSGASQVLDLKGATLSAMYRKDRVACISGQGQLREYRLKPESKTRRVVAICCNSAMFLEFTSGHWLDIYGSLWPESRRPVPEMRTMVGDLPADIRLPADIPNAKGHSVRFFVKLLAAWVAMRFRAPQVAFINGELDVHNR